MGKEEIQRLDSLMGSALLDETVRRRLVDERDTALLADFGISAETQSWLRSVKAGSLTELAQAIVEKSQGDIFVIAA